MAAVERNNFLLVPALADILLLTGTLKGRFLVRKDPHLQGPMVVYSWKLQPKPTPLLIRCSIGTYTKSQLPTEPILAHLLCHWFYKVEECRHLRNWYGRSWRILSCRLLARVL